MKKEDIENRDIELIKKFRTIVQNKKEIEGKKTPKKFPFGLILLITILLISSLLFLKEKPLSLFSKEPEISSRGELVPVPGGQPVPEINTDQIKATPDTQTISPPTQKEVMDKETVPKSSDSVLNDPVFKQNSSEKFSNQKVQVDMPSGIRIEKILSCSSVKNHQYSRPKIKFSITQDAAPKIWMKVISENPPFTLTHVYYCNGQKHCEVPLTIQHHRMRTWSTVTLRAPKHVGKWRVEVIDDNGAKLDQIEFNVVK